MTEGLLAALVIAAALFLSLLVTFLVARFILGRFDDVDDPVVPSGHWDPGPIYRIPGGWPPR